MKKRQVIILWVVAAALGAAVAAVKLGENHATGPTTQRKPGETLFTSFPAAEAATIEIQGASGNAILTKKDGRWVVAARDNFPANATYVNSFLRTLGELKVTRSLEAGPSFAPRFGMDEASAKPAERGLTATFKDAAGKEIAKVSLGKNIEPNADSQDMPMGGGGVGRYLWNHADSSGFYASGEMFPSVSADPKRWLSDGFINPEKIRSIALTEPGKTAPSWKLVRESDEAEFKLDGAKPAEVLNTTVTGPLKGLFSYARFEDVVPAAKVAEKTAGDQKHGAVIETFDGFTYTVTLTPAKPDAAPATPDDPEATPPATDNFLMTVTVAAEIPKERTKGADEKPEDAKTKDEEFAARRKTLEEKLAKEKALSGIVFEVGKSLVDPLLKDRTALLTEAKPAEPANGLNPGTQSLPGGMIARPPVSATTPPIQVPSGDE